MRLSGVGCVMKRSLSVVQDHGLPAIKPETTAQRVRRLQAEAKELAAAHIGALTAAMVQAIHIADEIADGGDAYPPGVRDMARRFVEDSLSRVQSIQAIAGRS